MFDLQVGSPSSLEFHLLVIHLCYRSPRFPRQYQPIHAQFLSALIQSTHQVLRRPSTSSLDFHCPDGNDLIQLQCIRQIIIFRQLVRSTHCLHIRLNIHIGMEPAFKCLGPCSLLVFLKHFSWKWSWQETTQTSDIGLWAFLLMGITLFHSSNKDWSLGIPKNEKKGWYYI
jgi:hypothetical protein